MNSIGINMGYLFEQQNWDEVIFVGYTMKRDGWSAQHEFL